MNSKKSISVSTLGWVFAFLYFVSYVTRIHFAAMIQEVVTDTGFAKSELSTVLVCLSVAYGVGQVISGFLGDRIKPYYLILGGLCLTTAVNAVFPLCADSVTLMAVMWGINGFSQAMLWPPMVKILVGAADEKAYGTAVMRISWGSSAGTVAVYLIAPLMIGLAGWRGMFAVSATVGLGATVLWLFLRRRIPTPALPSLADKGDEKEGKQGARIRLPREALLPFVLIAFGIVFHGMLRDGVQSWMPTYLAEVFSFGNQEAILCTVALAVFSIICFGLFDTLYRKCFRNEVFCAGLIFAGASLCALVMFLFFDAAAAVAILAMTLITGAMHGVNLMLIGHVPKRFKAYGNISTVSGLLNACTYVGSAVATYGIAKLSELVGWQYTVALWAVIAAAGGGCCVIGAIFWRRFIQQKDARVS